MVQKLGKNCHGCSIFELGCASGCASVLPCVHAVSEQRGSLSVCGERPCSPCATGGVPHRALRGEPRALASALRLPVRRADVFVLPLRGRAALETVCDRSVFPGDRRALGKAAFARSPASPVLLRCRRAARIARAFLRIKNRKSGLAQTNAFRYYISRDADVAQLVEHDLAKVGVAGSNPVVRSIVYERPVIRKGFGRPFS